MEFAPYAFIISAIYISVKSITKKNRYIFLLLGYKFYLWLLRQYYILFIDAKLFCWMSDISLQTTTVNDVCTTKKCHTLQNCHKNCSKKGTQLGCLLRFC